MLKGRNFLPVESKFRDAGLCTMEEMLVVFALLLPNACWDVLEEEAWEASDENFFVFVVYWWLDVFTSPVSNASSSLCVIVDFAESEKKVQ